MEFIIIAVGVSTLLVNPLNPTKTIVVQPEFLHNNGKKFDLTIATNPFLFHVFYLCLMLEHQKKSDEINYSTFHMSYPAKILRRYHRIRGCNRSNSYKSPHSRQTVSGIPELNFI